MRWLSSAICNIRRLHHIACHFLRIAYQTKRFVFRFSYEIFVLNNNIAERVKCWRPQQIVPAFRIKHGNRISSSLKQRKILNSPPVLIHSHNLKSLLFSQFAKQNRRNYNWTVLETCTEYMPEFRWTGSPWILQQYRFPSHYSRFYDSRRRSE